MKAAKEDKVIDYQLLESEANIFSLKSLLFTQMIHGVMWLLNVINVFIVDSDLMNRSFFGSFTVVLVTVGICAVLGTKRPQTKYLIMAALVLEVTIVNINLTYHTVLLFVLPLLYSIQYCNRRFVYFSYILSVTSIFISCMAGYFNGLCDANMAAITVHPLSEYYNNVTGKLDFGYINPNPWISLTLFYVLPRSLILLVLIPVTRSISDNIAKRAIREQTLSRLSEEDRMTSLYNRNQYIKMIQEYYPAIQSVGVIFWDVNGLKETNDTHGHEYGDYLITSISDSILKITEESKKAYRIGGDEFVMIVEDATEGMIQTILNKWRKEIKKKNEISKIKISVSVGYALGNGTELEEIIKKADENMYLEKKKYYLNGD